MNLSKEQTRLSKEQIAEIAEYVVHLRNILRDKYFIAEELAKRFTEKFGQQPGAKEESWPKDGDHYFWIMADGNIEESRWCSCGFDENVQSIGNIYRTKEEAENFVRLKKHIQKYTVLKGEPFWRFGRLPENSAMYDWYDQSDFGEYHWLEWNQFYSGLIMPLSSTKEDRAERRGLLKKCFS